MKSYHDIVGDGGSDVLGQVQAQRRRLEQNLSGVRHLVAVGSGKGGVGKSTLTAQLAVSLQTAGHRSAILDADLNGPTQARLGGLRDGTLVPGRRGLALPRTAEGVGVVSLGSVVPESEAVDFPSQVAGDSHVWRATKEFTALGDLLAGVEWGELDFLLLDLPPGAERTFQYAEFLGPRAAFVLVTIPSEVSRGVVARSVSALAGTTNPVLGYVENMKGYYCAGCRSVKPLFPDSAAPYGVRIEVPCLGQVPFDPELAHACDRGLTPAADGAGMRALREIADRIVSALEEMP